MNKLISIIVAVPFLCSCSVTQPVWDGTKEGVNTVVDTGEDLVVSVWTGGRDLVGNGVYAVEGAVEGTYDFVTGPFTSEEE